MAINSVSAAERFGYVLKEEQRKVVSSFVGGEDVLRTGYGKSLCYTCLPEIFDGLREDSLLSIVIVVKPLVAIAKDQVSVFIL